MKASREAYCDKDRILVETVVASSEPAGKLGEEVGRVISDVFRVDHPASDYPGRLPTRCIRRHILQGQAIITTSSIGLLRMHHGSLHVRALSALFKFALCAESHVKTATMAWKGLASVQSLQSKLSHCLARPKEGALPLPSIGQSGQGRVSRRLTRPRLD